MAAVLKNPEVLQCIDLEDTSFVETLLCLALSKVHLNPPQWVVLEQNVSFTP